jgi:uncharacterized protein YndB with AHSA1/START domain
MLASIKNRSSLVSALMSLVTTSASAQDSTLAQVVKHGDLETNVTVTLNAPRDAVFRALTSCEAIKQWMQPEKMSLADCSIDARVGGSLKLVFLASPDRRLTVRDAYRALEKPRLIQYEESYDFSPLTISVTATLEGAGERTMFKETLLYRSKQDRDTDFPGIAGSVPSAYAKLDRYLQAQ